MTYAFACRLARDWEPKRPARRFSFAFALDRLEFVQFDAVFQQRHAIRRVARLHGDGVGRGERIGQHRDAHAALRERAERLHAGLVRHEIGRKDQEFALGLLDQVARRSIGGLL